MFRGGKLVATSQDIYLVTEFADQGDLFNLRGQLREDEVRECPKLAYVRDGWWLGVRMCVLISSLWAL